MPVAVATWKEDLSGWAKAARTIQVQAAIRIKAEQMESYAKSLFTSMSHHESEPPVLYTSSFYIKRITGPIQGAGDLPGYGFQLGNIDPIANLVEFGSHPGGHEDQPQTLRYRIFGRTIDAFTIGLV